MTSRTGLVILWAGTSVSFLAGCNLFPNFPEGGLVPRPCTAKRQEMLDEKFLKEQQAAAEASDPKPNQAALVGRTDSNFTAHRTIERISPYHGIGPTWTDKLTEMTGISEFDAPQSAEKSGQQENEQVLEMPPWLKAPAGREAVDGEKEKKKNPNDEPSLAPAPPREPLVLALESFLNNQPDAAVNHLRGYNPQSQEVFLRVLPLMAQLTRKPPDSLEPHEISLLCEQFDGLLLALRSQAELIIEKMCFCEHVEGYGMYRPLPENYIFRAKSDKGPGEQVQIYVQLRNPSCAKRGAAYETRLSAAVQIVDALGKVWYYCDFKDRDETIRSQAPRRDFFLSYALYVPRIPAGTYRLIIEIKDRTKPGAERTARRELPFHVGL